MNVHFTYKVDKSPSAERYLQSQIEKLGPRLQVFNPDMVSLRGLIEAGPKSGFRLALNLRLPSGQMAAQAISESLRAAIRIAFEDLSIQLRKHKDRLRSQYRFPGVRGTGRQPIAPQTRFEETVAVIQPAKVSSLDVNSFVNANLDRLRRYVERELAFRLDSGQRFLQEVSVEEVVDEAIADALDEHRPRPEKIALEPWLYRLTRSAMDRLSNQLASGAGTERTVHAESYPALDAADEEMLQFYQPDEIHAPERAGANPTLAGRLIGSPEDEAASEELLDMVERALRGAAPQQREAFLLFTMEGFRPAEIAEITERTAEEVQSDIRQAREYLRRSLGARSERRPKPAAERVQAHPKSA